MKIPIPHTQRLLLTVLLLTAAPTYSMEPLRKKLKTTASRLAAAVGLFEHDDSDSPAPASIEQEVQNAFAQTNLPRVLLPIILGYCSDDYTGHTIMLPERPTIWWDIRNKFRYPRHSAVNCSFQGSSVLRVLDTNGVYHFYDASTETWTRQENAHVPRAQLHYHLPSMSIFVANELLGCVASSYLYEARITGCSQKIINHDLGYWVNGVHGAHWYKNDSTERISDPESGATLQIIKKSERFALASILKVPLPEGALEKRGTMMEGNLFADIISQPRPKTTYELFFQDTD